MRKIIDWFWILTAIFWIPFWAEKKAGAERYYPEELVELGDGGEYRTQL